MQKKLCLRHFSATAMQSSTTGAARNKGRMKEEEKNNILKAKKKQPLGIFTPGLLGFFEANPGVIAPFVLFI